MSPLTDLITAEEPEVRNRSLDDACDGLSADELLQQCEALEQLRHESGNLYHRVRALLFLYAIHRFHLPRLLDAGAGGALPYRGCAYLLDRRFEEAIDAFLSVQAEDGPSDALCSALSQVYRDLAFQTLADEVRRRVQSPVGNRWMFRIRHPEDHPLRIRREMLARESADVPFPLLRETTPVRMDFSHSGASDIFFLAMDYPESARVINASIDLCVLDGETEAVPQPPVEAYVRVIDEPVLRLASVDLQSQAEITSLAEVFDFARDYLGLLKSAVIASGIVPPGMEGAQQPLSDLLGRMIQPGHGLEVVSHVNDIPKGSRLAVSTSLLSCLISACMRATGQTTALVGQLPEDDRRLVAARAILGEWLGGSGGGWQDSGGVWPGIKKILGGLAQEGDDEYGASRGRLLPNHHVLGTEEVSEETRKQIQDSLVLAHGGMAQDVGPILERVTEDYLLRSAREWEARAQSGALYDRILGQLRSGDVKGIAQSVHEGSVGSNRVILRWSDNLFTDRLLQRVGEEFGDDFWGFWMLGGMSGGGMGFFFAPDKKRTAQTRLRELMRQTKDELQHALPFAMDPVVYDFALNESGTYAELLTGGSALMPKGYYPLVVPDLLRADPSDVTPARRAELDQFGAACQTDPTLSGMVQTLFAQALPQTEQSCEERGELEALLSEFGFDRDAHEEIRADLQSGRIGLARNRLPDALHIEDVRPGDVYDARTVTGNREFAEQGIDALSRGEVAVVTLAAGAGSRWTQGAGVVKALSPFCRLSGEYRTFIETHLAKSRKTGSQYGTFPVHVLTTSYLTHEPIRAYLEREANYGYTGPMALSPGRSIGLRLVPMVRDLRFLWEEAPQQLLDERSQKVLESGRAAQMGWAESAGEGSDYTDNDAVQCVHPVGHWYEIPNLLMNGVLAQLIETRPNTKHLMVHNIDTVGADLDPALLGYHLAQDAAMTVEVMTRHLEDRGGGLARLDGRLQLIEGLALPNEEIEYDLSYFNTNTFWIELDKLLRVFGLRRDELANAERVTEAVRQVAARMKTYVTIKEVKKRWGLGQEDVYPVAQFEKLWGDMTALPELDCRFVVVPRVRGQQLKEPAQLDGWLRDGSAAHAESLCRWE